MSLKRLGMITCLGMMLFLGGCASVSRFFEPPPLSPEAEAHLTFIQSQNNGLKMSKGLGKAAINSQGERQALRLAWIGERPNRLRIGVLNPYGTPTITIAADGQYFYALSHMDARFFKTRDSSPGLSHVIHIPIQIEDVFELMCGRIPIKAFHTADVSSPENGKTTISLKSRWGKTINRIRLDDTENQVVEYEHFDSTGKSVYRVMLCDYREIREFSIPFKIEIMNKETHFSLQIERYWANPKIPASAFVLEEPNT